MSISTVESSIILRLQSYISDLKVEGFPEKPAEYKLIHPKGAILVQFKGATYTPPESIKAIQQKACLNFGFSLMVRGLRDNNGAYAYIDLIISSLTGYAPTGCGKMYPVKVDFLKEDNGVWQYALAFIVPTENYGA